MTPHRLSVVAVAFALLAGCAPTPAPGQGGSGGSGAPPTGAGGSSGAGTGGSSGAGTGGTGGTGPGAGGATGAGGAATDAGPPRDAAAETRPDTGTTPDTGTPPTTSGPIGWASMAGGTRGGEGGDTVSVNSLSALNTQAAGTAARIIMVSGNLSGTARIGSNKTIIGTAGATITGTVEINGSANVIFRNLKLVGGSGGDCITINSAAHHVWVDHCDISDAPDGNLDISEAADYITVSWTRFSYSSNSGNHRFSNLIGANDTDTGDRGHLRVTYHNDWWAANVAERMPRVRFGQVHVFNSLFTSSGNNYCMRGGIEANILSENNAFVGVSDPFNIETAGAIIQTRGDLFTSVSGNRAGSGTAFTPPYPYQPADASTVQAAVMAGAGPR